MDGSPLIRKFPNGCQMVVQGQFHQMRPTAGYTASSVNGILGFSHAVKSCICICMSTLCKLKLFYVYFPKLQINYLEIIYQHTFLDLCLAVAVSLPWWTPFYLLVTGISLLCHRTI